MKKALKSITRVFDNIMAYVFAAMIVVCFLIVTAMAYFLAILPTYEFISDVRWHNAGHPSDAKHPYYVNTNSGMVSADTYDGAVFTIKDFILCPGDSVIRVWPASNIPPTCPICQGRDKQDNAVIRGIWPLANINSEVPYLWPCTIVKNGTSTRVMFRQVPVCEIITEQEEPIKVREDED